LAKGSENDADDLQQLKAIVAEQQQRLEMLEAGNGAPNGETKAKKATRRQLLKLAGASLVGAAGAAALKAMPAAAADGDIVHVGDFHTETLGLNTAIDQTTAIQQYPGVWSAYGTTSTIGFWASVGGYGQGVLGQQYGGTYGYGVRGVSQHVGVRGDGFIGGVFIDAGGGNGSGVVADSAYGSQGVFASSFPTGSVGVRAFGAKGGTAVTGYNGNPNSLVFYGYTGATGTLGMGIISQHGSAAEFIGLGGYGVAAAGVQGGVFGIAAGSNSALGGSSYAGPDLKLFGTGRLVQYNSITGGVYGAPTYTPAYGYFEMIRDSYGAMWANRPTAAGFSGQNAWKRINAVRVDASDGTGVAYKPLRLVDSRFGIGGPAGPFADNTNHTYVVAGAGSGTQKIPSTAVAVIGNLTAVGFTPAGGFLAIHPTGTAFNPNADPSSLNFSGSVGAWANSFVCGLGTGSSSGKLTVYVKCYSGGHTNIIIDITGYIE